MFFFKWLVKVTANVWVNVDMCKFFFVNYSSSLKEKPVHFCHFPVLLCE